VGDHKGHHISDHLLEPPVVKIDPLVKKKNVIQKKLEASIAESEIFEDDVIEIEE